MFLDSLSLGKRSRNQHDFLQARWDVHVSFCFNKASLSIEIPYELTLYRNVSLRIYGLKLV